MKQKIDAAGLATWLLAGICMVSVGARADDGFTITTSRENAVAVGMSTAEVQQLLGRPARAVQYRASPGPVWTYIVVGALFGRTEFNIDFGPDLRVIAKSEYVVGSNSANRGASN